jgi:hypothetical protein
MFRIDFPVETAIPVPEDIERWPVATALAASSPRYTPMTVERESYPQTAPAVLHHQNQ